MPFMLDGSEDSLRMSTLLQNVGSLLQLIGWIIVMVFLWNGRKEIAVKFGRGVECCPDCLCVCCCYSLTLIQEFKVIKMGVPQQATGPALVGAPVMMAAPPVVQGTVVQPVAAPAGS
eukprot:gnl/TRDRNA2_/TRDRNA2_165670_c0_seq2.p1 gnl/TRDRNA2_/TRDRNA2_165670_c0~~gnl/TRDRNA2_/TRDRNA2_165670_c0_seq2.p1  ORF type:complete len:132 (-),score=17.38 gnl/TRDRNA2_/TRDRNA2_165670_c0_seq2:63-413(-)